MNPSVQVLPGIHPEDHYVRRPVTKIPIPPLARVAPEKPFPTIKHALPKNTTAMPGTPLPVYGRVPFIKTSLGYNRTNPAFRG